MINRDNYLFKLMVTNVKDYWQLHGKQIDNEHQQTDGAIPNEVAVEFCLEHMAPINSTVRRLSRYYGMEELVHTVAAAVVLVP